MKEIKKKLQKHTSETPIILNNSLISELEKKVVEGKRVSMPKYGTTHFSLSSYYKFVVRFPHE